MNHIIEDLKHELDELRREEPECTCTQTDADCYDARGCECHDSGSDWRREIEELEERLDNARSDDAYARSGEGSWIEEAA